MGRVFPNILVVGTPGVGKTTFCDSLLDSTKMAHVEVSKLIKEWKLYKEWDDEMDCSIFDTDLVVDNLREHVQGGNAIVDFHSCDFLPVEWFDTVIVLRADTAVLYDRLQARCYSDAKVRQNVDCEIFQVLLDEARSVFDSSMVREMVNNNNNDLLKNVAEVVAWRDEWMAENGAARDMQ